MDQQDPKAEKPPLWIGLGCAAFGLYFVIVGLGFLPVPGGSSNLHGPLWIAFCAGLAFLLAGLAVIIQSFGHANAQGELPAGAPAWMKAAQSLIVVAIAASLATIGSWVAFGPGHRAFGGSIPLVGGAGEMIGRAVFGFGAILTWLMVIAFLVRAKRQIFGGGKR